MRWLGCLVKIGWVVTNFAADCLIALIFGVLVGAWVRGGYRIVELLGWRVDLVIQVRNDWRATSVGRELEGIAVATVLVWNIGLIFRATEQPRSEAGSWELL